MPKFELFTTHPVQINAGEHPETGVIGNIVKVDGQEISPPPVDPEPDPEPDPDNDRDEALKTAKRVIYVAKDGNNGNTGLARDQAKQTIQAGLDLLKAGDALLVGDGLYHERPSIMGLNGTSSEPIWIAAENPGKVIVSDEWPAARSGSQNWRNDGGGVYSAPHGDVYAGHHNGDFLFRYKSLNDLKASKVQGVNKPAYGLAVQGGRVYVRLRDDKNPRNENIHITETFNRVTWRFSRCNYIILDGFEISGAGNQRAVLFENSCVRPTIRNCISDLARFTVQVKDHAIVEWNEYRYTGFGHWCAEVNALNPGQVNPYFKLVKDYFQENGNAFLEGSLYQTQFGEVGSNLRSCNNYMHDVFDGSRLGNFNDSEEYLNVYQRCADDSVQFEHDRPNKAGNNLLHYNNLHIDGFGPAFSHTGDGQDGNVYVFRNVIDVSNSTTYHPEFLLKTIRRAPKLRAHHFHNLYTITTRAPNGRFLWYDYSNGNADCVQNFLNNIVRSIDDIPQHGGKDPKNIDCTCYEGPKHTPHIQGPNGMRTSDARINGDYTLKEDSPAINMGRPLPGELQAVDKLIGGEVSNKDAGPFPFGFKPWDEWPRPIRTAFTQKAPERWTLNEQ